MQGIFRKENTDKALKYGIYRHLPTYEKIIRNLVSFYVKNIEDEIEKLELEINSQNKDTIKSWQFYKNYLDKFIVDAKSQDCKIQK